MKGLAFWTISLFCLLAILIKGFQGFFIKHSQSKLCVKPEQRPFLDEYWGSVYYVEFHDGCLHPDAQFHFIDNEYVQNIAKDGTLIARNAAKYLDRFLVYVALVEGNKKFVRELRFRLNQTMSGSLSMYNGSYCATPDGSTTPSEGTYLKRTTTCDQDLQKFTFGSVTDKDSTMTDVNCASSQKMEVVKAEFGQFSDGKPFVYNNDTKCSSFALCFVKAHCDGKISCNMTADSNLFKLSQCPKTSSQLYMEYNCVDTPAITTVSKIRLSQTPNQGYIEVFHGTTWIAADDKTWSKEKEVALCHHLGFINTKSGSGNKGWTINAGQKLASGDLYCYGSQPTNTSCCAQLVPSTSSKASNIPTAQCLICNEPLLEDSGKFPNTIFTASDANGYKARVTNNGWCPTKSGSKFLQIDLQREYYITYIATFGDKAQTKWLESYSLQYSRTSAGLGSSTMKTVTANNNAYQASVVKLDIAQARYLKITPKQGEDFCLRVELCGHVLHPDPVQNVVVDTITARSARVSWSLPQNEGHSAVTDFLIFLNGTQKQTVALQAGIKNYTLNIVLKPYRNYEVAIKAKNIYGVGENVSKTFQTDEAVPGGPPLNVAVVSQNSTTLKVSWQSPRQDLLNGIITRYNICYSTTGDKEKCFEVKSVTSYDIKNLQPAVEYFVKVSAGTKVGYGVFSQNINKITNQERVMPSNKTYYSLNINLEEPRDKVQSILVIVQASNISSKTTDEYALDELKPFVNGSSAPYVTAGLNASGLSRTFVIGDGMWYNLSKASYFNQPLKEDTDYIVFLRFIESKNNYSTDWSNSVKVFKRPAAPQIAGILSNGTNGLNISWRQPSLPKYQTAMKYIISYRKSNQSINIVMAPASLFYVLEGLEYETTYYISVETVTQAGKSEASNETTTTTNSEPLPSPVKNDKSYTVTLRKPKNIAIINVKLIVLKLLSESTFPTPPEEIKPINFSAVKNDGDNVAFIAMEINVDDFKENTIKVTLQVSDAKKRRRRALESRVVLEPGLVYRTAQFNYDASGKQFPSYWSESFSVPKDPGGKGGTPPPAAAGGDGNNNGTLIAIIVGVAVAVILLVIVGIIFLKRRSHRSSSKNDVDVDKGNAEVVVAFENVLDNPDGEPVVSVYNVSNDVIYSNETGVPKKAHVPIAVAEFAHYVHEMKANEEEAFKKEYEQLPKTSEASWEVAKRPMNKPKNRYGNIVTYDHSRVVLSGDENSDYINASFMDGIEPNSYIASQAPKAVTVDDMWRMVWEQQTYSIVMVTSLMELGKPKCDKYWPDQGSEKYGDIEVTLVKTEEFACHKTHTLEIKRDDEEREVKHYYFVSWPDHGVPKYPTQLLAFRRNFRTHHLKQSGPIIVHCSAGVGRTGVFLAIDSILEKFEKRLIDSIDVFNQVTAMRGRRMNMIQTLQQYIFVHEAILETVLCGMNEVDSNNISQEIKKLSKVQAGGMTGFQEKFKRLGDVTPKFFDEECEAGLLEENQARNRFKDIYPAETNRVNLTYIDGVDSSDYINAVFVQGYLGRNYFIATQSPLLNTVNDFWRMVHEKKSSTIVLLNNVKEGTAFPIFWPTARAKAKQYDCLTVQLDSESEKDGIATRKLALSPYPDLHEAQVVKIFQYSKWPDHGIPATADDVITLTSLVEKSRQSSGKGPVIVVCSNGAGRSGTYIAISNLIERMKIEQAVDVFQSIKIIRASRPQFVENADQYQFCYSAVSSYLDAFSEYSNFE